MIACAQAGGGMVQGLGGWGGGWIRTGQRKSGSGAPARRSLVYLQCPRYTLSQSAVRGGRGHLSLNCMHRRTQPAVELTSATHMSRRTYSSSSLS